jgi:DNA-3-methyladenine glycosylase
VDGSAYGTSVLDGTGPILLSAAREPVDPARIRSGPRVGVTGAHDLEWRFWLDGEPTVSPYRRHTPRAGPGSGPSKPLR